MDPAFADIYDACAWQWEELCKDLQLRKCDPHFWLLFWSTHQRFFKSLYVAAKLLFLLKQAREALAQGYVPIIGLITTGESHIKGQLDGNAQRVADGEEDDMNVEEISQCRGVMKSFLKNHVKDASLGHHLKWLDAIGPRLPPNPLDALIEGLGGHTVVAELTGRTIRKKNGRYRKSATSQETHELERTAFQCGQKKVAVISAAASVGISLHCDRREPTADKRRMHFVLELALGADKVMQQLGRSHRTNQQTGPIYKLIVTEQVGADIRFISTVARRLQSLGAITQGHEGAVNNAMDLREYNVWSRHGDRTLGRLKHLRTKDLPLLHALQMVYGVDIKTFLKRCLGFELNIQHVLLNKFFELFNEVVNEAKREGTYENAGITNLRGTALDVQRVETFRVLPPAVPVPPPSPPPQQQQGAAAAIDVVDVEGEDAPEENQEIEEEKESFVSLVTLKMDRGIPYDRAEQMLLAEAGGEGRRGGIYLRRDSRRPFLALDRGGGQVFKVLYPDTGPEAYVKLTPGVLSQQQYLTPNEAEGPWTARYRASLTHCLPHQCPNCCEKGVRMHTAYLLTFDTARHWKLERDNVKLKRLRTIRATTTSEPRKSYEGVMLTSRTFHRVAGHSKLVAVPEHEVVAVKQDDEEDKRVDVLSLLEEGARTSSSWRTSWTCWLSSGTRR